MARRDKKKAKSEEDDEQKESKSLMYLTDDDDEANEDLSLKIVEKALLMRAVKLPENNNDGDDSKDGRAIVRGAVGGDGGGVVLLELASSSSLEAEPVVTGPTGVKKKKKKTKDKVQKTEVEEISVNQGKEGEVAETIEKAGTIEKVEAVDAMDVVGTADPNPPEISDNMVLRKLLRGPRYFDPPDSGWSRCYNCGEEGHVAVSCPLFKKRIKPCFICGSLDHGARQCKKARDCYICKKGGHRVKDCPDKQKGATQSAKMCLNCGDSGHDMFLCRNGYSSDDLKEIQCYVCKSFGHLCCVNFVDCSPREVSCYKCGEGNHTGLTCLKLCGETTNAELPSTCYKCGDEGHFARECTSSAKPRKRNHELSTPTLRHGENKSNSGIKSSQPRQKKKPKPKPKLGIKSAPSHLGQSPKKRKTKPDGRGITTPQRSEHRGGWTTQHPGDLPQSKNRWRSPSTPSYNGHRNSSVPYGSHYSDSRSPANVHMNYSGASGSQGPVAGFQHRYAATMNRRMGYLGPPAPGSQGHVAGLPSRYAASYNGTDLRRHYGWW